MALLTKDDLGTNMYPEVVDEITRTNDADVSTAISRAEMEARSFLNRYDLATMWAAPWSTTEQGLYLKGLVVDIATWFLVKKANPNINIEVARTAYVDAIKTFTEIQKGIRDPEWPLKPNDPDTLNDEGGHIFWDSNAKRRNHY